MTRGLIIVALVVGGCVLAGCGLSMTQQRKLKTYAPTALWPDGASARPLPDDVVAQGDVERAAAAKTPPPVTAALLARGRERFDIFCAPCHGLAGDGDGIIVAHGFPAPPSYHIDRLRRRAGAAFLRRDDRRLWRHVLLCGPRRSARSLGDRRLYPRAATVAPRHRRRRFPMPRRTCDERPQCQRNAVAGRRACRAQRGSAWCSIVVAVFERKTPQPAGCRLCVLGANPGRQPDAVDDSPAHRRPLGRDRRAGRSRPPRPRRRCSSFWRCRCSSRSRRSIRGRTLRRRSSRTCCRII